MKITMYEACVPVFVRMLGHLAGFLEKGAAHAEAHGVEPRALLACRLAADMYPLSKQVRIACDVAIDAAARLAGRPLPEQGEEEGSFPELLARVRGAIAYLETLSPGEFDGAEERVVSWTARGTAVSVKGSAYLLNHAMPKFYFHLTTAYAILRHEGVALRKGDFMGKAES